MRSRERSGRGGKKNPNRLIIRVTSKHIPVRVEASVPFKKIFLYKSLITVWSMTQSG